MFRTEHRVPAAPTEQRLTASLQPQQVVVAPDTDQEDVAPLVSQYELASLPVVAADGRMSEIIIVDDVIDVLVEEPTEKVLRFGGVARSPTHEGYFAVPIWRAVRRRVMWLMLFLTSTVPVNVLDFFEDALAQVVALSFFSPLLIGTGGNTGAQTVSTLVRGLALGDVQVRDVWHVLGSELVGGVVLGLLLNGVGLAVVLLQGNPALGAGGRCVGGGDLCLGQRDRCVGATAGTAHRA